MSSSDEHPAEAFHREVDALAARLEAHHRLRLQCRRGCSGCCVDGISVFEVEADLIRRRHGRLLASGTAHPAGACAFLDQEGGCRIYAERPYVCRTQGLPLRWLDESDGSPVEQRDICPLNEPGTPLIELRAGECWTLGPAEAKLRAVQQRFAGNLARVRLRELFRR